MLRDPAEAEDVLQTVFLEIHQVAHVFDRSRGTAKAWILRYAYHRSLNRRAYLRVRGLYDRDDALRLERATRENTIPGPGDGREWNACELKRFLEEGMAVVTPHQRTTLYLAFFHC